MTTVYDLTGKVAFITDGTGGLGSATATTLLARGARVAIVDIDPATPQIAERMSSSAVIKHGVDEDPTVVELLSTLPRLLLKRLQPEVAAAAIVDGLVQRSPRVMQPARWRPLSALRGVISPAFDARLAKDRRTLAILAKLDAR